MGMSREYRDVSALNKDIIVIDGFEKAYVGFVRRARVPTIAVYDYDSCVEIIMEEKGGSWYDAVEWMEENVCGVYKGRNTPGFLFLLEEQSDEEEGEF